MKTRFISILRRFWVILGHLWKQGSNCITWEADPPMRLVLYFSFVNVAGTRLEVALSNSPNTRRHENTHLCASIYLHVTVFWKNLHIVMRLQASKPSASCDSVQAIKRNAQLPQNLTQVPEHPKIAESGYFAHFLA